MPRVALVTYGISSPIDYFLVGWHSSLIVWQVIALDITKEGLKYLSIFIHSNVYTDISHVLVILVVHIYSLIAVDVSHPMTVVHHVIKESP